MKHYRLLMGLAVGVLCFGRAGALSVAVAGTVELPNFVKHNQGIEATSTGPSPSASPSPSTESGKPNPCPVAKITVDLDSDGYVKYQIIDKWQVPGDPKHKKHVSKENHKSTLFKTVFVAGTLNPTTLSDGEVQISGTDSITQETLIWESSQNTNPDDDVTWTQTQ
jgi:hypothetical protein